jgi:lipopolysaccharide/colanic/teichoic acid biosynthesis glycosyltransferase
MYIQFGKRTFDLILVLPALIALSPFLLLAILLIWLDSPGPIFFTQKRIGHKGRIFKLYKFRTMTHRDRDMSEQVFGRAKGVTRIGYWLRRGKVDELPQLINILKGDMSVVGPRPALPENIHEFNDDGCMRLEVRPGLTGLAQINGNIHLTWPERWKYDAMYVKQLSLILDIKIILCTVVVVIVGEEKFVNRDTSCRH